MFYYDTEAQRQIARERVEQLACDMRRIPASADIDWRRGSWRIVDLLLSARLARQRRVRAHAQRG